jgi:hypothetical protein
VTDCADYGFYLLLCLQSISLELLLLPGAAGSCHVSCHAGLGVGIGYSLVHGLLRDPALTVAP